MRRMHIPVRMADGRVSTVGEGRGVWLCWLHRLPAPEPQYEVREPGTGRLVATVDWGWPDHETFGEFDGFVKYGRLLKPGQDAGSVVFAEKQREDEIRDVTGGRVVRVIWSDYDRPHLTAQRIPGKVVPEGLGGVAAAWVRLPTVVKPHVPGRAHHRGVQVHLHTVTKPHLPGRAHHGKCRFACIP